MGERHFLASELMVDYSRFDAIARACEDEDDGRTRASPRVTRLNGKTAVTFGGTGQRDGDDDAADDDDDDDDDDDGDFDLESFDERRVNARREHGEMEVDMSEREFASIKDARARRARAKLANEKGAATRAGDGAETRDWQACVRDMSRNGAIEREHGTEKYFWRQDAREVVASVVVAPGTRARDVEVGVDARRLRVRVRDASGEMRDVFDAEWAYEIAPEARDDEDEDAAAAPTYGDWEITDFEGYGGRARRVVRVTARKKSSDVIKHWWRLCFKGATEVDPGTFEDRNATAAASARRAWEEAQDAFRERVKNRELIEVEANE